jgi:ABC-type Fe3+-hydroxamate transport system substrate-binding protein
MEQKAFFTDMMGRAVALTGAPTRIVSLVPSQTELLYHFGLEKEVVGITKFCISPESWWRSKQRVGGTKNVNREVLAALQPDLIIGNKEENTAEDIAWLEKRFPVWMSDIYTLSDALVMISAVGEVTGKKEESNQLCLKIKDAFSAYIPAVASRVAYLIWNDPPMAVNGQTFNAAFVGCGKCL